MPVGHRPAVVGRQVALTGYAVADAPLAGLELWADGALVDAVAAGGGRTDEGHVFGWTPGAPGLHALSLRAVDVTDRSARSALVWVRVVGRAPGSVAAPAAWPADGAAPAATPRPLSETPAAPSVSLDAGGCTATLTMRAQPGADGIALLSAGFGARGFRALDLVPAGGGTVSVPLLPTPRIVYADVYHGRIEHSSAPVLVPGHDCAVGESTGELGFDAGILTASRDAQAAYLFLHVDGEPWRRVPARDQTFVAAGADGSFDFSTALPPLTVDRGYTVEAWGRSGGALVALGSVAYRPKQHPATGAALVPQTVTESKLGIVGNGALPDGGFGEVLSSFAKVCLYPQPTGAPGSQVIGTYPEDCLAVSDVHTLRWTAFSGVDHGILQISTKPFPSGPALDLPGLIESRSVSPGLIPIDVAAILDPPTAAGSGSSTLIDYQTLKDLVGTPGTVVPGGGTALAQEDAALPWLPPEPGHLYLRVVASDGTKPVAGTSNTVAVELRRTPPAGTLKIPHPEAISVKVTSAIAPGLPNPAYARCVRVVDTPFTNGANPAPAAQPGWPSLQPLYDQFAPAIPGATICAKYDPPEEDWWDIIADAVAFMTDVWDAFVDFYGNLKSAVVNGIVSITGCQPKDVCAAAVGALVDTGLAALGVPPTLPKWEAVVSAAEGHLQDLAVATLAAGGMDCGVAQEACEKMAGQLTGELIKAVHQHVSQAAVAAAGGGDWYIYLNPKIMVVPEPVSTLQPGIFLLTVTRSASALAKPVQPCTVWGHVTGSQPAWTWHNEKLKAYVTGPVSGEFMVPVEQELQLSALAPGASTTVAMAVPDLSEWYLPGQSLVEVGWSKYHPSPWIFFQKGSTITMTLHGCGVDFTQSFPQDGTYVLPAEYPYP